MHPIANNDRFAINDRMGGRATEKGERGLKLTVHSEMSSPEQVEVVSSSIARRSKAHVNQGWRSARSASCDVAEKRPVLICHIEAVEPIGRCRERVSCEVANS